MPAAAVAAAVAAPRPVLQIVRAHNHLFRGGLEPGCRASWPTPILLSASNASGIVSAGDSGADERRLVCEKMAKRNSSVELAEKRKMEIHTHTQTHTTPSLSTSFSTLAQLPFLPVHGTIRYRKTYLTRSLYVSSVSETEDSSLFSF